MIRLQYRIRYKWKKTTYLDHSARLKLSAQVVNFAAMNVGVELAALDVAVCWRAATGAALRAVRVPGIGGCLLFRWCTT